MFLTSYTFDGDLTELLPAYDRLQANFGLETLDLHICTSSSTGIVVLDACPSAEVAAAFSSSPEFGAAVAHAGLPTPRVTLLGDVRVAHVREGVRR